MADRNLRYLGFERDKPMLRKRMGRGEKFAFYAGVIAVILWLVTYFINR